MLQLFGVLLERFQLGFELRCFVDNGCEGIYILAKSVQPAAHAWILARGLGLLELVPDDRVKVLESGVTSREDVARAEAAGAHAVLVGEALMRAPEPARRIRELLAG